MITDPLIGTDDLSQLRDNNPHTDKNKSHRLIADSLIVRWFSVESAI